LALDKEEDFSGREALRRQRARGLSRRLVGLRLRERGIPRAGQEVRLDGEPAGLVTSGTHSPVLQCGIGLAYMRSPAVTPGQAVEVIVRDRSLSAEVVHLPFVESRVKRRRRNRHGE
jgi:aminomethyltransferase